MKAILKITVIILLSSCATSHVATYDLLDYNENDFKVVSYEFPYAEVILLDSTVKYIYCPYCNITGKGYLISDR